MQAPLVQPFNRRRFLAASALAAGHYAFGQPSRRLRLTLGTEPGFVIPDDFLGLGYEISSPARPGLLSASNRVYVQLVKTLGPQGVIRIGGNTADYATYAPTGQPISTSFGTVVNDAVLHDLGTFLEATDWKLIWALNLGRGTAENAIAEARMIQKIAGPRLLAFEIGNEPDLFPSQKHRPAPYIYDQWLADYRRVKAALREALPKVPLCGPDTAGHVDWVTRYAADEGRDAVLLTHHYYRENENPTSTIAKLLGPDPKLPGELSAMRSASKASGLPYRICEVNSFSGGGKPGVSDTLAATLWVLDYLYTLASDGCAGVNLETGVNQRDFISSYSPIGDDEQGHYTARPEYYGMLAFAQSGHGHLLPATLDAAPPELKVYATKTISGEVSLTIINKGAETASIVVGLPKATRKATLLRLTGPSLDAKQSVMLGAAEVAPDGTWKPLRQESFPIRAKTATLDIPAGSAAILRMS